MDWAGIGLRERVLAWLENAANDRYARDRRLDPFATSMRNFDDVSENLRSIREGRPLAVTDPRQRITDLKGAGFVADDGEHLTKLGAAVLGAWEKYGVASDSIDDELARLLLMVLEARRLNDPNVAEFLNYWVDLRAHFDPLELLRNWDALYAINFLDFPRGDFSPGAVYRDEKIPVSEIEFDLDEYAQDTGGSRQAIDGGVRVERALAGQIPRGRHRATFCMALEIVVSDGNAAASILNTFGVPKKPRSWEPFNKTQKAKIIAILAEYGVASKGAIVESVTVDKAPSAEPIAAETPAVIPVPTLPEKIDFSQVLEKPPTPKASKGMASGKGTGQKKPDYAKKAKVNDAVGKLGEDFAIKYEFWRLRKYPNLRKKIRHVSKEDDTLGYDIESFEIDGTPRFVEVKGTLGPMESRFFLSYSELECAKKLGRNYVVLRVAQLSSNPKCCEVRYPFDKTLDLTAYTYSATFK